MNASGLRSPALALILVLGLAAPASAQLSFSQASVFTGGAKSHGSSVNTQTVSGAAVTLTYATASSFATISGATTFGALPLDSFFLGTDNVFGAYNHGFTSGGTYYSGQGATDGTIYAVRLSPIAGYPNVTISGGFTAGSTTEPNGAHMDWSWKVVSYDGASSYTTLASGSFHQVSVGSPNTDLSVLGGSGLTLNGSATGLSASGAWLGVFFQGSNPGGGGFDVGAHFNTVMNLTFTAVPEPAPTALVLAAGVIVYAMRRRSMRRRLAWRRGVNP
jgi:hypothetical protein